MKAISWFFAAILLVATPMAGHGRTITPKMYEVTGSGANTRSRGITPVFTNLRTVAGDTIVAIQHLRSYHGVLEFRGDSTYLAPGTTILTNAKVCFYGRALAGDSTGNDTRPVRILASGMRDIQSADGGTMDRDAGLRVYEELKAYRIEVEGFSPADGNGGTAITAQHGSRLYLYDSLTRRNIHGIMIPSYGYPTQGVSTEVRTFRCSFADSLRSVSVTIHEGVVYQDEYSHFNRAVLVREGRLLSAPGVVRSEAIFMGSSFDSTAFGYPNYFLGGDRCTIQPSVDFDGDGWVGLSDFLAFAENHWQETAGRPELEKFDFDGDGVVSINDVSSNSMSNSVFNDQWRKQTRPGVEPLGDATPQQVERLRRVVDLGNTEWDVVFLSYMPREVAELLATATPSRLASDFDGDGTVNFADFFIFASEFGKTASSSPTAAMCDLDHDGTVNFADFFIFASEFGKTANGLAKPAVMAATQEQIKMVRLFLAGHPEFLPLLPPELKATLTVENQVLPRQFALEQNFPNPFNPATSISYSLPEAAATRLVIYNLAGQVVRVLQDRMQEAGAHTIRWNGLDGLGRPCASGHYFYQLRAGAYGDTRRMLLLK